LEATSLTGCVEMKYFFSLTTPRRRFIHHHTTGDSRLMASNALLLFHSIRLFAPAPPCRQTQLFIPLTHRHVAARMELSQAKYEFVEEIERLDYYVPGGYHPVMIGDELGTGRYVIAHKLGFGRSTTT
jgi:hypothetical protein